MLQNLHMRKYRELNYLKGFKKFYLIGMYIDRSSESQTLFYNFVIFHDSYMALVQSRSSVGGQRMLESGFNG